MATHEDMDDLEYRALEMALDGPHPALVVLRRQLPGLRVTGRDSIPGGFVAHLEVEEDVDEVAAPRSFQLLDVHGHLKGVRAEIGFIVFVEEGRLARLEGQVSGSEPWPGAPALRDLFYKHPQKPGSIDLVRCFERDYGWALGPEAGFSDRDLDETEPQPTNETTPRPERVDPPKQPSMEVEMSSTPLSADETQQVPLEDLPATSAHSLSLEDAESPPPEVAESPPPEVACEEPETSRFLPTGRLMYLLATNVFLATLLALLTTYLLVKAKYLAPLAAGPALGAASPEIRQILVSALLTVAAAGALGAVLTNLRGMFQHNRDESGFPTRMEIPFYLRPLTGALTGLLSLLAINLILVALTAGVATAGWATMPGRMAYVGIALIIGFGAQEGLERLREILRSVIGQR